MKLRFTNTSPKRKKKELKNGYQDVVRIQSKLKQNVYGKKVMMGDFWAAKRIVLFDL